MWLVFNAIGASINTAVWECRGHSCLESTSDLWDYFSTESKSVWMYLQQTCTLYKPPHPHSGDALVIFQFLRTGFGCQPNAICLFYGLAERKARSVLEIVYNLLRSRKWFNGFYTLTYSISYIRPYGTDKKKKFSMWCARLFAVWPAQDTELLFFLLFRAKNPQNTEIDPQTTNVHKVF